MNFTEYLLEARRNPEQNPRYSTFLQLRKIAEKYGTDDIFVRYVDIPKLGHNIGTADDTPLGIYAYPLDYVIKNLGRVPYGYDRLYVLVFRVKSMDKIWDLHDPNPERIRNRLINVLNKNFDRNLVDQYVSMYQGAQRSSQLWHTMYALIQHNNLSHSKKNDYVATERSMAARRILLQAGIEGAIDLNEGGIIHENEPTQAVFFNIKNLELLDVIRTNYYLTTNKKGYRQRTSQRRHNNDVDWRNRLRYAVDNKTRDKGVEKSALHFIQLMDAEQTKAFITLWCERLVNYLIATNQTYFDGLYDCLSYSPDAAYRYCELVLQDRCPELEKTIASDPPTAFDYAVNFIKGRWREGEHAIYSEGWGSLKTEYELFIKRTKPTSSEPKPSFRERLGKVNI